MGAITGVVMDESGAVIAGARVTVKDVETNETRSVQTEATGAYTVGPLRLGTYDVSVEQQGFKKGLSKGVVIHAQDRARVDFKLNIGQVVANPPSTVTRNTYDTRVDHNFSDSDKVFGRFSHQTLVSDIDSIFPEPARGDLGNTYSINTNPAYSAAFSYTRILRPTLVNEFRAPARISTSGSVLWSAVCLNCPSAEDASG